MTDARHQTGRDGETIAAAFLAMRGATIVHRNWRSSLKGVRGEIDIIAQFGDTICFVEVKTRASSSHGEPQEAVTPAKQRQICRLATAFTMEFEPTEATIRFDIVEVWLAPDKQSKPRVAWLENAFPFQQSQTRGF